GEVEQQRVLLGGGVVEVPDLVPGEPLGLRVHAERLVVGDVYGLRGVPPACRLLGVDAQLAGPVGGPFGHVGRPERVGTPHQVRIDVVVGDRAVFVGAGDAVDVELSLGIVVAQRAPQPRGVRQQVHPRVALELHVAGGVDVTDRGGGDVGVDVD